MPICGHCGTGLPVGYEYCFKCGRPVRGEAGQGSMPWDAAVGFATPVVAPQGVWPRAAAACIDALLVILVYCFIGALVVLAATRQPDYLQTHESAVLNALLIGALWAALFLYGGLFEGLAGTTLGKMIFRMRVVGRDGRSCGLGAALLRNLFKSATVMLVLPTVGLILILPLVLVAVTDDKQRLGDMAARTTVVKRPQAIVVPARAAVLPAQPGPPPPPMPPGQPPEGWEPPPWPYGPPPWTQGPPPWAGGPDSGPSPNAEAPPPTTPWVDEAPGAAAPPDSVSAPDAPEPPPA